MEFLSERLGSLDLAHTALMDETAVFFEDPRRQTIDVTGARHVVLKSTGFASMRVTAVLAVSASGRKLPPLIVWKGARQDGAIERIGKAVVWDSTRAHTSKVVKARFAKKNVQTLVVPGGLTPYVQAGDIGIYKSFKDKLSSIIDEWKSSDRVEYMKGGNPKQPPVNDVVEWVQSAWKAVPDDVINRSVQAAGFSPLYED
ncbi:hypothetical protein PI124_g13471 [Phytophthora idaei]|nr:hypothetical protein PI124_g13471 [Phytophthora idaei]